MMLLAERIQKTIIETRREVAEKAISPFSLRRRKGQIQREIALQYYLLNNLVERERERVMGGSEKGNMMGEIKNG